MSVEAEHFVAVACSLVDSRYLGDPLGPKGRCYDCSILKFGEHLSQYDISE
jgi:hypothetical protein